MPCSWGEIWSQQEGVSWRPQAAGHVLSSWGAKSDIAHQHLCSWVFRISAASGESIFPVEWGMGDFQGPGLWE